MLQQRFQRAVLSEVRRRCSGGSIRLRRPFVSMTRPMWEKHTVALPTMGDSITEGTVVEWVVAVGQAVKEEDVVALVETDKVTVDIKAKMNGVVTKQFAAVDETVEVGAPLYEIDTEAEATVSASETKAVAPAPTVEDDSAIVAASPAAESSTAAQQQSQQQQQQQQHHHVPMIKFLGKEGWERVLSGKEAEATPATVAAPPSGAMVTTSTTTTSSSSLAITVVDSSMIHPMYGRPPFTAEEMETLILGGANRAPKILAHNSVTKFKQVVA